MFVRARLLTLLAAGGLAVAALAPTTVAGAAEGGAVDRPAPTQQRLAGGWKQVSSGAVDTLSEITLARTADGVLHAVYVQDVGTSDEYEHAAISTAGTVVARSKPVGTWGALVHNPELLRSQTGGLRLVFSGLQDTDTGNFYSHGYAYDTTSDISGAAWGLQPHALTKFGAVYSGYGLGATTLSNGTPVTAGTLNSSISYRVGDIATTDQGTVSAAPDDGVYTSPACCLYDTQLVNSGDSVWMAWYANGGSEATSGVFVQQVHPSVGAVVKAPGSSVGGDSLSSDQAIAMVARPGGGVVLAYKLGYPTTTAIGLWQVGTSKVVKVPGSKGADLIALDTGATGRMWLAWSTDGNTAYALRTAPTGFGLGAVQDLGSPARSSAIWSIAVDASLDQGTVLVNDSTARRISLRTVKPGLTLTASGRLRARVSGSVKVKVTDAGTALQGVKVSGGGDSCTTKANGTCSLSVTPKKAGNLAFVATEGGYGAGKDVVKVKK
ncbi:hypothetical protein [Nocardioides zhouii]|uniref:Uncharacterized protein n=1 Tax=Nocardioides zhouii TaxID=1168729 RepID=A0A4Q2T2B5_9ACTN|nr:hypothetical protein [Nocardioides zhouii]RYC11130.1 hypothetical protein EUA94_11025 [Nocardioides zhouii]